MNFKEKVDRLDGLFAWDTGCKSSGVKDSDFKRYLMVNTKDLEVLLTELAKRYLNSEGYTIEDIALLLQWSKNEFNLVYE